MKKKRSLEMPQRTISYDYQCAHEHSCPHLEGLSTQWVFEEYKRNEIEQSQLWEVIEDQEKVIREQEKQIAEKDRENAQLKATIKALHKRQFKPKRKKPPNIDKKDSSEKDKKKGDNKPKKKGAPVGHPGWSRPEPDRIDKTVEVPAPEECSNCKSTRLEPISEVDEHIQEDIILVPRTVVTRYLHHQSQCLKCGKVTAGVGENEIPNAHIGPVAKSVSIYLRQEMGLSYRKVQRLFDQLFGLKFVPASAVNFDRKAAAKGQSIYEDLKEKIRASEHVHADETHWREDGDNHYVWYAGNQDLAIFHIDKHRSSDVAVNLLGDEFGGVLIADGYAAYNAVNASKRQSCLAHLIRRAEEISEEIPGSGKKGHDRKSKRFLARVAKLLRIVTRVSKRLGVNSWKRIRADSYAKRLDRVLKKVCASPLPHEKSEKFRKRLCGKEQEMLFTCIREPDVQATNNQAEQSLRPVVIQRKTSFGTRSAIGSWTHGILLSLTQTAKRQDKCPREFFELLLTSSPATAQAALYRNPP